MAFTEVSTNIFAIDGLTEDGAEFLLDLSGTTPEAPLFPFTNGVLPADDTVLRFSPYLAGGTVVPTLPAIDTSELVVLLLGMLGLGGARTLEKVKGMK